MKEDGYDKGMVRRAGILTILSIGLPLGGLLVGPTLGPALRGLSFSLFQPAPPFHAIFHRHGPHPR